MNKTKLRNFSVQARIKLLNAIKQKAYKFGITENEIEPVTEGVVINGRVLGEKELKQYQQLVKRISSEGYDRIMEEAAYTWFNRFIALRYMEVNDFLPIHLRILSSETVGKSEPDALTNITSLIDELDLERELVYKLQDESDYEYLYQYLLIQQCNKLGEIIPNVFEYISDDMALLLPDNLLNENSVVRDVVTMVEEEDWENVEVVGWLYQFYISEQKDAAFASKKKFGKDEIGPVTQLFTPRWIVEYMVDNSLGRLWLESYPDKELKEWMDYYLDDAEQTDVVTVQLETLKDPNLDIESIKFMDPSCGSGHILVYAFELFYQIYLSRGYLEREIPQLILENNLYGLDIDTRATQLATFAVVMKAREYDRRLFNRDYKVNIYSIEESNAISEDELITFAKDNKEVYTEVKKLVDTFYDGKLYGSIIKIPEINIAIVEDQIRYIRNKAEVDIFTAGLLDYVAPLLKDLITQYHALNQKYEVVVTNPPYMGSGKMDPKITKYVRKYYNDEKSDLFSVMMKKMMDDLIEQNGFIGNVTMQSWMFLSSFDKFRENMLEKFSIVSMSHMDNMVMGIAFGTAATIFRKKIDYYKGKYQYIKLKDIVEDEPVQFPVTKHRYNEISANNFNEIPGNPIVYWMSDKILDVFKNSKPLSDFAITRRGLQTGNSIEFVRLWYEVLNNKINGYDFVEDHKWFFFNSGGNYRKWYGNLEKVVNWENNGEEIKCRPNSIIPSEELYFKEAITWNKVTSGKISFRYQSKAVIPGDAGPFMIPKESNNIFYLQALFNSKAAEKLLSFISPTLNFEVGNMLNVPIVINNLKKRSIILLTKENIKNSKYDWNSLETSWDFQEHPFLIYREETLTIEESYNKWEEIAENRFYQLKENEEELNRIFIDIYGLEDELTPEVEEKDVTVRKADKESDVKRFLSYLVGVLFGRYSLDEAGLAYAGGEWDESKYKRFQPVDDNIIPMTSDGYFEQDIISKIESLITIIYSKETLEENLHFIAQALNKRQNETDRDRIRRYFMTEFFKDHSRIYQKRPIYWEFSSGKRGAFRGLMYLHRYDRDTIARLRTDYVLTESKTLDNLILLEEHIVEDENSSNPQKARAEKAIENYQKDKKEIAEYAELLDHVARGRIELDLDDGVKVNYEKFQKIEIVDNQTGKTKKQDVLSKI